jgi:hypothetical protein
MIRRMVVGMLALAALAAGGLALFRRRGRGQAGEHDAVQWPFETDELRSLMSRVVAEQRDRINTIEDAAGRGRAQAFLEYYERRRQAAAS